MVTGEDVSSEGEASGRWILSEGEAGAHGGGGRWRK